MLSAALFLRLFPVLQSDRLQTMSTTLARAQRQNGFVDDGKKGGGGVVAVEEEAKWLERGRAAKQQQAKEEEEAGEKKRENAIVRGQSPHRPIGLGEGGTGSRQAGVQPAADPSLWTAGIDNGPLSSGQERRGGSPAPSHWVPSRRVERRSWRRSSQAGVSPDPGRPLPTCRMGAGAMPSVATALFRSAIHIVQGTCREYLL